MAGHHAIIAPSSLALTVKCQAWVKLAQGLPPEPDTEATMEGNAADWVAKQYAAGNEVAYGTPTPVPGYTVDHDMIHGAKMWRDVLGYGSVSGVPVVCERIHPTDCWGEPDGWRWDPIEGILRVPDYKYGFEPHNVFEHWQIIAYATGLMDSLGLNDFDIRIEFIIVQPRAHHKDGPVRRWLTHGDQIRALVNTAHDAAIHAWPPEHLQGVMTPPPATAGVHCLHCPARSVCATFSTMAGKVMQFASEAHRVDMSPQDVGAQLALVQDAIEVLKGKESALSAQAEAFIRAGKRVPNFTMEAVDGRLQWLPDVNADEIIALGQLMPKPIDLKKAPGEINSRSSAIVTPTQAIKAGMAAEVIQQYADRPAGYSKLTREEESDTRRAFGG